MCGRISLLGSDHMQTCKGAWAIAILTEWDAFKTYDYQSIATVMAKTTKTIFDFRGILPEAVLSKALSPFSKSFQIGVGWIK
mmetsp:Transcript_559/g.708  ORF Transcript_559/g.708 Transcript_559/m.708 type:complete len:82 (+) Transcript_559:1427-1672(+)